MGKLVVGYFQKHLRVHGNANHNYIAEDCLPEVTRYLDKPRWDDTGILLLQQLEAFHSMYLVGVT